MSWWRKLFGRPASERKSYYNREWNFSITHPNDWKLLWENRPRGVWAYTAFGGRSRTKIPPSLAVLARREEVIAGNNRVPVEQTGGDGTMRTSPKTPTEFMEIMKQGLTNALPKLAFYSTEGVTRASRRC